MPSHRDDPEVIAASQGLAIKGNQMTVPEPERPPVKLKEALHSPEAESNAQRLLRRIKKTYGYGEDLDPLAFMAHVMMNNLAGLNLHGIAPGQTFEIEDNIPIKQRLDAAKDLAKYLYPQLKSTEIKTDITVNGTIESKNQVLVGVMDLLNQAARDKAINSVREKQPDVIDHRPTEMETE